MVKYINLNVILSFFMKWRLEWPHYADLRNQVKTVVPWSKLGVASCSQKKIYEHVYLGSQGVCVFDKNLKFVNSRGHDFHENTC